MRPDREITPKLLRQLLIVAAHRGFMAGQQKIRRDRITPPVEVKLLPERVADAVA
jgi:hypothetical protein